MDKDDITFPMIVLFILAAFVVSALVWFAVRGPSHTRGDAGNVKQHTVTSTVDLYTAEVDGHQYVVAVGIDSVALVHGASCPCHGKGAKDGR